MQITITHDQTEVTIKQHKAPAPAGAFAMPLTAVWSCSIMVKHPIWCKNGVNEAAGHAGSLVLQGFKAKNQNTVTNLQQTPGLC